MNCDQASHLHLLALSGETTRDQEMEVYKHVEQCMACKELFAQNDLLLQRYRQSNCIFTPSDQVRCAVIHGGVVAKKRLARKSTILRFSIFISTAAAVLFLAFFLNQSKVDSSSLPEATTALTEDRTDLVVSSIFDSLELSIQEGDAIMTQLGTSPLLSIHTDSDLWIDNDHDFYLDIIDDLQNELMVVDSI